MRSRIDCALELKAVTDEGDIEGMASVFGNVDFGLDRIEAGAFSASLKSLDSLPMLWQHRHDEPIGIWSELTETRKGLRVKGELNLEVNRAREARALAKQGAVTGLSIGFFPRKWSWEDDVRVLEEVELVETSLVTFPMNDRARVVGVKNSTRAEVERMLRTELGLSRRAAEALATGGYSALKAYIGDDDGESRESRDPELEGALARIRGLTTR